MNAFLQRGGWWVIGQNALMLAVLVLGPLIHGSGWPPAVTIAGRILLVLGAVFGITGVCAMGRNLTPYPSPRADGRLVQSGIYSLVRHPLYSSLIFVGVGWALTCASWVALGAAAALAFLLDAKASVEERHLRRRHPEYADYASRVRRFIPWVY